MRPNNDDGRTDDEQLLTPDLPPPVEGVPEPGPATDEDRAGEQSEDREEDDEARERESRDRGDRGAREESDAPEPPD